MNHPSILVGNSIYRRCIDHVLHNHHLHLGKVFGTGTYLHANLVDINIVQVDDHDDHLSHNHIHHGHCSWLGTRWIHVLALLLFLHLVHMLHQQILGNNNKFHHCKYHVQNNLVDILL